MTSSTTSRQPRRGPGRPREFDIDAALDGAVRVFRQRGYHATSVEDLCLAMNLTAGSIYKAFSDKRTVFLAAFERYTSQRNAELQTRLKGETNGLAKIRAILHFYAESSSGKEGRQGCLVAASAMALATFDEEMAQRIEETLRRLERMLKDFVHEGQTDGSISPTIDASTAACSLLCLLQGFRVVGKLGRSRGEMVSAANEAIRGLA